MMENTLSNISLERNNSILKRFVKMYWTDINFMRECKPDIYSFAHKYVKAIPNQIKNVLALFYFKFWTEEYMQKHPTEQEIRDFIEDYNAWVLSSQKQLQS